MTDESSQPKVKSFVHRIPNPVGRPYKIKSSKELWDKFVAYCDDVENDPWQQKTGSNSIAGGSGYAGCAAAPAVCGANTAAATYTSARPLCT